MVFLQQFAMAIWLCAMCLSCSDDFKLFAPLEYDGKFPDESAKDIEIVCSESGTLSLIIFAPVLNKYLSDTTYIECPAGVKITSFDEHGQVRSLLSAKRAYSKDNDALMEIRDSVVVHDLQKNEIIETEKIVWDKNKHMIFSDTEVRRTNADGSIDIGSSFEGNERMTKYTIKNIRGEKTFDEED